MSAQAASSNSNSEAHHQRQQSYVAAPSSRPPVSLPGSAHLDPNTAVRGTHQITIGQHAVIHPRCQLYTDHGPLTIGENTLISERCIIGDVGASKQPPEGAASSTQPSAANATLPSSQSGVSIGSQVHLYPSVQIQSPSSIGACSVLESNVVVSPHASIGTHCKICANITVPAGMVVPDFTVVYGDSERPQRRMRRQPQDAAEQARLKVLDREREASLVLLRQTALKSLSSGSTRKK